MRHNTEEPPQSATMCKPIDGEPSNQATMLEQIGSRAFASWLWTSTTPPMESQATIIPPSRRRTASHDVAQSSLRQQVHRRLSLDEREKDSLLENPCKPAPAGRRSLSRKLMLLFCAVVATVLFWCLCTALTGATPADVREIDDRVKSFYISDEDQEARLKEIKTSFDASGGRAPRVLVVGMAESLQELQENKPVISGITSLCWVHAGHNRGGVDVRILYKSSKMEYPGQNSKKSAASVSADDDQRLNSLQSVLNEYGCNVVLEPEEIVWQNLEGQERQKAMEEFLQLNRYKRLAKLRSFHRNHILHSLDSVDYDVVVNVDMDVVQLPPVLAMLHSMDRMVSDAESGAGNVVCANGFEVWKFPFGIKRQMFYDTLAAIHADGAWGYHRLTTSVAGVFRFSQNTFLRDILRQKDEMLPMQSCYGGVAMYDFDTWATPDCDYDQDRIKYVPPFDPTERPSRKLRATALHALESQLHRERWTLDAKYTLQGTGGGDACEHVMFQKCLYDRNRAQGKRVLNIGIQPDLVIERGSAMLGRWEDVMRVSYYLILFLGDRALVITLAALTMFLLIGFVGLAKRARKTQKHVHEA